jgi:hypothetical protein
MRRVDLIRIKGGAYLAQMLQKWRKIAVRIERF